MRVIAGHLGGRRLVAPRGLTTRPTTDRVREALFSALGPVQGAHVLDLYAGTGALGIEALSRGAASAVFVESAHPALAALRANLAGLALAPAVRVLPAYVARAVPRVVAHPYAPFHLVFADPPYDDIDEALTNLEALLPAIAPGARIVLEHATRHPPRPTNVFHTLRTRMYGDTTIAYLAATRDAFPDAPDEHAADSDDSPADAPPASENGHVRRSR